MKQISEKNQKYAVYESFIKAALWTRKNWQQEMRSKLVLRNQFTERSISFDKPKGSKHGPISKIQLTIGSRAEYMDQVEEGETEHKKGKHGVAVPMPDASGQKTWPTTKVVRENKRIGNVVIHRGVASANSVSGTKADKQKIAIALRLAKKQPKVGYAFMDLGKVKGVFRIRKRGKPILVWNYSKGTVRMKPHRTLEPVVYKAAKILPYIMELEMQMQIRRAMARL